MLVTVPDTGQETWTSIFMASKTMIASPTFVTIRNTTPGISKLNERGMETDLLALHAGVS